MAASEVADLFSHLPLYQEVKQRLIHGLANQEWRPGEALPAETKLARQFSVSVGTIRKAVDELVADNILVRQQGRGTFVAAHTRDRNVYNFFHIVREDGAVEYPVPELVAFEQVRADVATAAIFDIKRNARMYLIRMSHLLGGRPAILNDIRLPASLFPALTEKTFTGRGEMTLYAFYQAKYGINVIRTEENVRAIPADPASAAYLGVAEGAPLLEIVRVAYTYNDRAVEMRRSLANTDHHRYRTSMARKL